MTAKIINGKEISEKILNEIKIKVENLVIKPTLAVISVGNNSASEIYVRNKENRAKEVGFNSIVKKLPEETSKDELLDTIGKLNQNPDINGILLQLPLPKHLNEKDFLDKISPIKDVDGFNTYNAGKLFKGETPYAIPCTPKGILKIFEEEKIELEGKTITVIGRSNIVGKPLSALLTMKNATVILAHSKTKNLKELSKISDIVIAAVGKSGFLKENMIKEGAIVIDVGINRDNDGKITGDVDFDTIVKKASFITPVPKGVGPLTIAMLISNTYELYKIQKGLE